MAIKFEFAGATFTVDTPQEAADLLALLRTKAAAQKRERREALARSFMERKVSESRAYMEQVQKELSASYENFKWTANRFLALVDRLGQAQKLALALLVTKRNVRDEELRNALNVPNNQALAGVLSGISKQAEALLIPPRAIFDFENLRVGGKRRSDYLVVNEFQQIAAEMNWPPPTLLPRP